MTVLLVRHAHAGDRGSVRPDEARPLSDLGWAQARALPDALAAYPVTSLLSSPFLRCRQTLEPLAEAHGLEVIDHPALAEAASAAAVLALLRDATDGTVMSSHGDVIPMALQMLESGGTRLLGPATWPKAGTWVLDGERGNFATATFVAPPDVSA